MGTSGEEWHLGFVGVEWLMCGARVPGGTGHCGQAGAFVGRRARTQQELFFFLGPTSVWGMDHFTFLNRLHSAQSPCWDLMHHSAMANEVVWVFF